MNQLEIINVEFMITACLNSTFKIYKVKDDIDLLIALFKSQNNKKLVRLLKDLIPEYKSNNSVFEQLDN